VALDNLADLAVTCVRHPAAPGHVFMVSDDDDLSTPELLRRTGRALGKPARLVPVSVALLRALAACAGRTDIADRLCGSLQVDLKKTRGLLSWTPPVSVDEGLRRAADHVMRQHHAAVPA
jgi:nucleoside-diphosphate-sugar epimerase